MERRKRRGGGLRVLLIEIYFNDAIFPGKKNPSGTRIQQGLVWAHVVICCYLLFVVVVVVVVASLQCR